MSSTRSVDSTADGHGGDDKSCWAQEEHFVAHEHAIGRPAQAVQHAGVVFAAEWHSGVLQTEIAHALEQRPEEFLSVHGVEAPPIEPLASASLGRQAIELLVYTLTPMSVEEAPPDAALI